MSKHTPGPWEIDPYDTTTIYGSSPKGRMRVADIRGWGHLTGRGHGALGLPEDEAVAIQDANAALIAAAPALYEYVASSASNGCATAKALIEAIDALTDKPGDER